MTELIDDIYASTARFLERELTRERRSEELRGSIDADFEANAVELGWYQLLIPESFDGLGLEPADLLPFFELMGRHLVPGFSRARMLLPGLVLSARGTSSRSLREPHWWERRLYQRASPTLMGTWWAAGDQPWVSCLRSTVA